MAKSTARPSTLIFETADDLQHQPRRGDDDVGRSSLPYFSAMPSRVKVSIWLVTTAARCSPDRLEQIGVGHQAEPLVPGIVARGEMGRDVVVGAERLLHAADDQLLHLLGLAPASWKKNMPNSTLRQRMR